ncbi:MAG: hydantoinase/oxoprolinase family protein [Candidatus Tectomicrobia bacterium]|nr:hydantoinase/oxoprolinase family protein [Candidatus Tectomicrobia bacterium]
MTRYQVGIDIGGTFTDFVVREMESGELSALKVPSTPPHFIEGVMDGLAKSGLAPEKLDLVKHGSTIATNAIIERRGARTGLLTTQGMRAVLEAARATRADIADLAWAPSPPLVPRRHILEAKERVDYEGNVLTPLDEATVREAGRIFRRRGMEAVAVVFLNSFMNPDHELRAKEILQECCPDAFVCCSYEVLPEMREFERTSTTAANAYLGPIVDRYLEELVSRFRGWGYHREVLVIHSAGGLMTCQAASRMPARICQSGPAGGVQGAVLVGKAAGFDNLITLDIGGTSADLSLVYQGTPRLTNAYSVEFNIPISLPVVDVKAIGAGGGSIAWIDPAGILKSGPQSAGAQPGPACYGAGGTEPTNTDANLVLGRLNPETFLGGEKTIREDLAREVIEKKVAAHFGMSVEAAAEAILRVSNANMVNGIRLISVERGYDPRDFILVAFGGAGPLHAVDLARELNIPKVLIPPLPGVTSALGVLATDLKYDFLASFLQRQSEVDVKTLNETYDRMEAEARSLLADAGAPEDKMRFERQADLRYFGKTSYLTIAVPNGRLNGGHVEEMLNLYNSEHQREYGYVASDVGEIEIANLRLIAHGPDSGVRPQKVSGRAEAGSALKGRRRVYFGQAGGYVETLVYDRARLGPGASFTGPAIVEQTDTTTVLPPGASAVVDSYQNLILTVDGG